MEQVIDTFHVNIIAMFGIVKASASLTAGSSIVTTTSVQAFNPSEHLLDYAQRRHQLPTLPLV